MRNIIVLLATAGLLLLGIAGSAQAAAPHFSTPQSTAALPLAALPQVDIPALPGSESLVTLTDQVGPPNGHVLSASPTIWSTVNFGPGTALFTGVPLISNLKVTIANASGVLQDGVAFPDNGIGGGSSPAFGGSMRINGQAIIYAGGGPVVAVPLSVIGGNNGETTMAALGTANLTITGGGGFRDGTVMITGITSNVISIPGRPATGAWFSLQPTPGETVMTPTTNGGFVSTATVASPVRFTQMTVTVTGTNSLLSAATTQDGSVTMLAPIRVQTGLIAGTIPGAGKVTFTFVPEPGTMLLLVSGAVGLAVIGRRRMRK